MSSEMPSAADTFLARRYNFLGLPSERRGGNVSYAELRAELGDENAAALVTKVGELVKSNGLERLGVSLHHAVDRVVQSLTADERRTVAEGGTVPRVQALISAEVSQAEAQQRGNRTSPDELKIAANGQYAGLGLLGGRNGANAANGGQAGSGREMSSYERQQTETIGKALALAEKYGLGWAASNPDLLRLGPAAIEILAQTKLREETFNRLTKDAGLSTKGAVGVAAMLHAQGKDANKDGQALAADINAINDPSFKAAIDARAQLQVPSPNETPAQKKAREAQIPAAEDQVRAAADAHVQKKPNDAVRVNRAMGTLGIAVKKNEAQATSTATQAAATVDKNAKANAKDAKADALLAELNDPKPTGPATKGQEQAPATSNQNRPNVPKPPGKPHAAPKP